jgi:hypothetical protein
VIEPGGMLVVACCVVVLLLALASTELMLQRKRYKKDGSRLEHALVCLRGIEVAGIANFANAHGAWFECVVCKSEAPSGNKIPHGQECPVGSAVRVLRDMRAM